MFNCYLRVKAGPVGRPDNLLILFTNYFADGLQNISSIYLSIFCFYGASWYVNRIR
jgi:hypothetical protein